MRSHSRWELVSSCELCPQLLQGWPGTLTHTLSELPTETSQSRCDQGKGNRVPQSREAPPQPRPRGRQHLREITCRIYAQPGPRPRAATGWGESSTCGHRRALVGPVRSYLASLSVFPLPGFSRLAKCRRHVRSVLEKLSGQHRFHTSLGSASTSPAGNRSHIQLPGTAHFRFSAYQKPEFPEVCLPAKATLPQAASGKCRFLGLVS